jgi:putative GTP pyrophosphokinase
LLNGGGAKKLLTISQLNKIGERLRKNLATEDDLRLLDEFRLSFQPAYDEVFAELSQMGLNPGGRPQKTTLSIIAKLNRERTRLSRMQDIAGCRVVVDNMLDQNRVIDDLKARWPEALVHDRRVKPSYGYRAVHMVVTIKEHPVEIQIRASLQHTWASTTEKLSDVFDPAIKYGGGPVWVQKILIATSESCAKFEETEFLHAQLLRKIENLPTMEKAEFETKIDEKFAQIIPEDENQARIAKMIQEEGVTNFLEKTKHVLKEMRDDLNAMLKKLPETDIIKYRDRKP